MTDRIDLTGLRVMARHGVLDEEKENKQPFVVDASLYLDLSPAGAHDDLAMTVDYGELAKQIHRLVKDESYDLIERLAERIAEMILTDERVARAVVTVHKPQAPIPVPFGDVAVTVDRGQ